MAGGRSTRMGQDKALMIWRGKSLISRQIEVLRTIQPDELLISGRSKEHYGEPDVPVVMDRKKGRGPLAGLCAAFAATKASHLLVLAVDMPNVNTAFLNELLSLCRPGTGVIPRLGSNFEPLLAVYPRRSYARAQSHLSDEHLKMQNFAEDAVADNELAVFEVAGPNELCFRNLNSPEDI